MNSRDLILASLPDPELLLGRLLDDVQEQKNAAKAKVSEEERLRDTVSALLRQLGAKTVQDDALTFAGEKFILPGQYEGPGGIKRAIKFLTDYENQQNKAFNFGKTYEYRPYDGAHAFAEVMKFLTGTTGFGVTRQTIFGPQPPEFKVIATGPHTSTQVPWGLVAFPMYEATFDVGYTTDAEKGILFHLSVEAPRKWRSHVQAIFDLIEKEVKENSIYRGHAITGGEWPEYMDTSTVNPAHVVYSEEVMAQLSAHVWAPLRYSRQMRAQGISLKRAALFAGPWGTGKTLGAMLTAQIAEQNDWTFIMCRTGKDDPKVVLQTAALYAPCVVVVEDIDVHAEGTSAMEISALLEMLDGVTNKGKEIVALFTTNHIEKIQKGALRPGRIDAVIEIKGLDRPGFEKLITISLGEDFLEAGIDWDAVAAAYEGFLPAFVREAAQRAQRFIIDRNHGKPGVVTTQDLILAADSLRPQLELMDNAKAGARHTTLEDAIRGVVDGSLSRTRLDSGYAPFVVDAPTLLNGAIK